jgi:YidC/Oxa1 family membrane protein insertase
MYQAFLNVLRVLFYYPFLNIMMFLIWLVPGNNAAWGIIGLTLIVRLLLLIPSQKATQAQRRMTQLQPLIDDLRQQYGEDRNGLVLAQMELYKQNGINPFSSCLLQFVQLPILIIMYRAILHGLDVNSPHLYAWLPRPEHINTIFAGINLTARDHTYILPVIAAVVQYIQVVMMLPPKSKNLQQKQDPNVAMQRQMAYIFPGMTLMISISLPAGVPLYWIISTLFTIGQQYVVKKERLGLKGVAAAKEEASELHPEKAATNRRTGKATTSSKGEVAVERPTSHTEVKKGVSVTVRKKGSS